MTGGWPRIALREVAAPVERGEQPVPGKTYRQVGVRLWGEGAYEREPLDGAATKYATLYQTEPGDIIVNKIWARNGSVAVVSPELGGCFGSGEFPMFAPDREHLDPRWFHWITKTRWFWQACDEHARGTSGKNRIRPEKFLEIDIPLPPLAEQRRIVAKIDQLAAKIAEARGLRDRTTVESDLLSSRVRRNLFDKIAAPQRPLRAVALKRTGQAYRAEDFSESGSVPVVRLKEISTKRPTVFLTNPEAYQNVWLDAGDIVLAKTSFSTGAMCIWPGPRAVLNQNAIMLRALDELTQRFLYEWLQNQVAAFLERQLADPNFYPYIREQDLLRWQVPLPPEPEQRRIVAHLDDLQAKVDRLKALQAQTAAELDALLPAILDKAFKGEV